MNRYQIVIVTEIDAENDQAADSAAKNAVSELNEAGRGSGGFFTARRLAEVSLE